MAGALLRPVVSFWPVVFWGAGHLPVHVARDCDMLKKLRAWAAAKTHGGPTSGGGLDGILHGLPHGFLHELLHGSRARRGPRGAGRGEVPVGAWSCVTARWWRGRQSHARDCDPTAHAEMLAIRAAAAKLGSERLTACDLYGDARALHHVRRRDLVRAYPQALLRGRRSQGWRGGQRRAVLLRAAPATTGRRSMAASAESEAARAAEGFLQRPARLKQLPQLLLHLRLDRLGGAQDRACLQEVERAEDADIAAAASGRARSWLELLGDDGVGHDQHASTTSASHGLGSRARSSAGSPETSTATMTSARPRRWSNGSGLVAPPSISTRSPITTGRIRPGIAIEAASAGLSGPDGYGHLAAAIEVGRDRR